MKNVIITIACTLFTLTIVQANQHNQVDSLSNKNYRYFEEKVMEFRKDTIKAVKITKYWLNKANKENNLNQQIKAYRLMMHLVDK